LQSFAVLAQIEAFELVLLLPAADLQSETRDMTSMPNTDAITAWPAS
jgi:hypothetical protein